MTVSCTSADSNNLILPIPVKLIFDEELVMWETSKYIIHEPENKDFRLGDEFEFFNTIDWEWIFFTSRRINQDDSQNKVIVSGLISRIPVSLLYCKHIVFKTQEDRKLAINLFGENEKFEVDSNLFLGGYNKTSISKKQNQKKSQKSIKERAKLTLNKDELAVVLHSFEVFMSNAYLRINDNLGIDNALQMYRPILRYSLFKSSFNAKEKLDELIDSKLKKLVLSDDNKDMLIKDLLNQFSKPYATAFNSYKKFYAYYLISNRWNLLEDCSDKSKPFIDVFNELIGNSLSDGIKSSLHMPIVLSIEEIDDAIEVIKQYNMFKFMEVLGKQEANIISETLSLEVLYKLIEFKDSLIGSDVVNIGDVVCLKNTETLICESYRVIETLNDSSYLKESNDVSCRGNIMDVTVASRIGSYINKSRLYDIIRIEEETFRIIDIAKENIEKEITLEIIDSYITDSWLEDICEFSGGEKGRYEFREETPLKQTGYSIWDGSRKRTREERWSVLINRSIPSLGIDEVIRTLQNHIYFRQDNTNAVKEWEYDLEKLRNLFYRKDKINYFD